jgi:DNA-binding MarR family transcriptional regulator
MKPAGPLSSALHLLHRASQRADSEFIRGIRDVSLTPRQFAVLAAVAGNSGLSQTDIMAATGIDRSGTADLVTRLVRNGSLRRRRNRRDARFYNVSITPLGQDKLQAGLRAATATDRQLLLRLSAVQREAFLATLKIVAVHKE